MKSVTIPALFLFSCSCAWARPEILDQLSSRVTAISSRGQIPVLVMDLDETLVDSTARKFQSYEDAMDQLCATHRTADCDRVAGLNIADFLSLANRYDADTLFHNAGVEDTDWQARLSRLAFGIYLSGKWMQLDQSVPGANSYVQGLRARGGTAFFVSSRLEATQKEGTLASLKHLGFLPDADPSAVFLRPDGMTSIDFKRMTFATIQGWVNAHHALVAGVFENEPENMNAMVDQFPDAYHVFVTGAFIKEEPLKPGVITIQDFR